MQFNSSQIPLRLLVASVFLGRDLETKLISDAKLDALIDNYDKEHHAFRDPDDLEAVFKEHGVLGFDIEHTQPDDSSEASFSLLYVRGNEAVEVNLSAPEWDKDDRDGRLDYVSEVMTLDEVRPMLEKGLADYRASFEAHLQRVVVKWNTMFVQLAARPA